MDRINRIFQDAHADAVDLACKESRLPRETFPATCPYTESQILDDDQYPATR
ncbi:DUF29 family protein [Thiobaca trueperi]|uniref:Uncharacterized protein DUF29 n=1 Tax=Thiobaca trueperi TaxID=127458 RepID=A0A4R3MVT4_9GAMM|nr:DUF29 family protein [Thiobaca trueperi]TCT20658.1 uncharacterized protein DUF29 [Thiobaca trueperi]